MGLYRLYWGEYTEWLGQHEALLEPGRDAADSGFFIAADARDMYAIMDRSLCEAGCGRYSWSCIQQSGHVMLTVKPGTTGRKLAWKLRDREPFKAGAGTTSRVTLDAGSSAFCAVKHVTVPELTDCSVVDRSRSAAGSNGLENIQVMRGRAHFGMYHQLSCRYLNRYVHQARIRDHSERSHSRTFAVRDSQFSDQVFYVQ